MYTVSNHVLGLSKRDSIKKNIIIHFPNGEYADIENDSIYSESMKLQQSVCSQEYLQFGLCEAAQFSIKLIGIEEALKGYEIEVSVYFDGDRENMVQLGTFKIDSDVPTDNKRFREIKAYDALYELNELDISKWYNSLSFPMTLKEFRESLFTYLGIEQEEVSLVNDDMVVERTISPTEMPATDILKAICEINGAFGQIGRNGKFKYVVLENAEEQVYPSDELYPSDDLFPNDGAVESFHKSLYISCEYEDYEVQSITGIQIRQEENDIGVIVGENDNAYVVEDNFLVYGKASEELRGVADKLLGRIAGVVFRPCELEAKALLYLEPGDYVKIYTNRMIFCTYILNRTISGIQSMKDSISSTCEREQSKKVGGVHQSIIQLKRKTNTLDRTLEETRSTLTSLETTIEEDYSTTEEMESLISQTAEGITTSVSKQITETKTYAAGAAQTAEDNANSNTDERLKNYSTTTESEKYADNAAREAANAAEENANSTTDEKLKSYSTTIQMNSAIEQSAEGITASVSKQITETRSYADSVAQTAEENANNSTNDKLKNYSTTEEMEDYADNVAQDAAGQAERNANSHTDEKLKAYSTTTQMQSAINQSAESIKSEVSKTYVTQTSMRESVDNLQQQIDGAIETFSGSDVPTLSNYPVSDWSDDATKDTHIGDLYIVNSEGGGNAGFYYRFEKTSAGYQWTLLKDNEITKALQDAKEANEKAQAVEDDLKENYSTTTEMNSAIEQTANAITLSVNEKITKTEGYAADVARQEANGAYSSANAATDEKLKQYSTTIEMNSIIQQTTQAINLEVSKKVGNDEIISKINQTAESIVISASKIDVDGVLNVEKLNALNIKAGSVAAENITGTTISGKTISGGSISIGTKFSVDKNGKATVADIEITGNGSLNFAYSSSKMSLDYSGISFGESSYYTSLTKEKLKIYNTYIDRDTVHCAKYGTSPYYYTDIYGDEITLVGSSYSKYLKITSSEMKWLNSSDAYYVKDYNGDILAYISSGKISICGANKTLAFFGQTGSTRKAVANLAASTTNISNVVTQLNLLIDALQAYGLIGG